MTQGRTPSQLLKAEAERWLLFRIVITFLCVLLLVAAGGCAAPADYWRKTDEAYRVVSAERVPNPGIYCEVCNGKQMDGYTVRDSFTKTAKIYIRSGLPKWLDECTEKHERFGHAAGYSHAYGAQSDCAY